MVKKFQLKDQLGKPLNYVGILRERKNKFKMGSIKLDSISKTIRFVK